MSSVLASAAYILKIVKMSSEDETIGETIGNKTIFEGLGI